MLIFQCPVASGQVCGCFELNIC